MNWEKSESKEWVGIEYFIIPKNILKICTTIISQDFGTEFEIKPIRLIDKKPKCNTQMMT